MVREYTKRIGVLLSGLAISAVGITMMLQANIGLEPWSVLQNGMSVFFPHSKRAFFVIKSFVIHYGLRCWSVAL